MNSMKAVVVREHGGRDVLRIEDMPVPEPKEGEVLIEVHAVSINRSLDIGIREGTYQGGTRNQPLPAILGIDPSGVVVATGPGVEGFKPGDRVTGGAAGGHGGYAQYALVTARAHKIPMGLSFEAATDRLGAAQDLGADFGVDYRHEDLPMRVAEITGGRGVDVVLENIGDPTLFPQAFNCLARGGRLVTIGAHGGGRVTLDVSRLYLQRLSVIHGMDGVLPGDVDEALQLGAEGTYKALVHAVLPLSQVAEAHRLVEEGLALGKVILDPTIG